ncbi:MAG: M48 family metalloprotease [Candidatus Rifleibacteriota bacterium]
MKTKLIVLLLILTFSSGLCYGKNPIIKYFARWLDETRAEMAIGKLMLNFFKNELDGSVKITLNEELAKRVKEIARQTGKPEIECEVYLIKSDIPDEIVFPGNTIVLTSGLIDSSENQSQLDFILARNLMHLVLKHPMKLLKKEGLYARMLNQIKLPNNKRDINKTRTLTRDYLRNLVKMDHKKADLQGILLMNSPEKARKAAINLLKKFTGRIWPVLPMDTGNLPGRIEALEKLKLPE